MITVWADYMQGGRLLLEMVAVLLSLQIVAMALQSLDVPGQHVARSLIFGFTLSSLLGLAHLFSYSGMPAWSTAAAPTFNLSMGVAARLAEALALILAARRVHLPGSSLLWGVVAVLLFKGLFVFALAGRLVLSWSQPLVWLLLSGLLLGGIGIYLHRLWRDRLPRLWLSVLTGLFLWLSVVAVAGQEPASPSQSFIGHGLRVLGLFLGYLSVVGAALRTPHAQLAESERRIRAQERQLDTVLNRMPAGVLRVDAQLKVLYMNAIQALRVSSDPQRVIGRALLELIAPDQRATVAKVAQRALAGKTSVFNSHAPDGQGGITHTQVTVVPEHGERGAVVGVMAFSLDVSPQVRVQQELSRSLREVSDLSQALDEHAIVAVTDAHGVIQSVNDRFCQISQYPREELVGRTHRVINSGVHEPGFFNELWAHITSGRIWSGDICNRARDGSLYWVQTTIVPQLDAEGRPRQYIAIRTDITQRRRLEDEIRQQALFDPLTELPNRRLLDDRIGQCRMASTRSGQFAALMMLDLDHFKAINDSLGHDAGDAVLIEVARRLRACLRQSDTAARLGGDEFVILLTDLGLDAERAREAAADVAEHMRAELALPHTLSGRTAGCTPSVGVTLFQSDALGADELLKRADLALYQAKAQGRNAVRFFDRACQPRRVAAPVAQAAAACVWVMDAQGRALGRQAQLAMDGPGSAGEAWVRSLVAVLALAAQPESTSLAVALDPLAGADEQLVPALERALGLLGADRRAIVVEMPPAMATRDGGALLSKLRKLGLRCSLVVRDVSELAHLGGLPIDELKVPVELPFAPRGDWDLVVDGINSQDSWALWCGRGAVAFQGPLFEPEGATP